MGNNSNKIVLAVFLVLLVGVIALVVGSGSCSGGGGGGGGAAPATSSAATQSAASSSASASAASATASSTSAAAPSASATPSTSEPSGPTGYENESYENMRDELMARLSEGTAPVGADARDAAASAGKTPTVAEVATELGKRGLTGAAITASFDMSGNYLGKTELDESSADKYPSYHTTYESKTGVIWTVVVNEGRWIAVPVGAANGSLAKELIFTEVDTVTQYDGTRNQYSEFSASDVQAEGGLLTKVGAIDAATLDSYSFDQLSRM